MSNHQFNRPIQLAGIYDRSRMQDHVSIHIESMLRSMPPTSLERSIFRVRHQLRKVNEKAYDPEVLAIGPYHYGNDKFKFMEEQKLRYLQQLLERRKESVDRYMPTLREMEQPARNRYAETIDLSQEKFLAMMLIDGCFIVELFRKYNMKTLTNGDDPLMEIPTTEDDPLMHELGIHNSIMRDLLLLENQLPLFVLSKLYDLTKDSGDEGEFHLHASLYFEGSIEGSIKNRTIGEESEHLLHLYHTWHTFGLPKRHRLDCKPVKISAKFSTTELSVSGVRFRAAKGDKLSDIKFENETLEIPVLKVEDHTESKFRNLIAYEKHRRRRDINYFTDYVNFMDNLINSSTDVELLRHKGIIKNYLGVDKVVAQMFNKMGNHMSISNSYYCKILQNVNAHCDKRENIWKAKLSTRTSFSIFAVIVFFLTVAQTVFTILSYTK